MTTKTTTTPEPEVLETDVFSFFQKDEEGAEPDVEAMVIDDEEDDIDTDDDMEEDDEEEEDDDYDYEEDEK